VGFKRYKPIYANVNGEEIQMINSYGFYTANYVKTTGKPYKAKDKKNDWYSKTQCKKMKMPVSKDEESR